MARRQYELLHDSPYQYTSDDLLFTVYAERNQLDAAELEAQRAAFFSKGQACLRSSPLAKTYGWGFHFDSESRVAIYPRGSEAYERLQADPSLKQLKAMRSSR